MYYVADTHSFIWYLTDSPQLSKKARAVFDSCDQGKDVNWSMVLEINKIKGLKDLHDRTIIATAKIFDAELISKDKIIKNYYKKTIW